MSEGAAKRGRRQARREEWGTQTRLAALLQHYLDPSTAFWSALENQPRTRLAGILQRRRGTRAGLPDLIVICGRPPVFVEVKSRAGIASKAQKQVRQELVAVGCHWWMARSARAALAALHRSGVPFRRQWTAPELEPWEGPFDDVKRVPRHPAVAARHREYARRWRERKWARALEARDDGAQPAASVAPA